MNKRTPRKRKYESPLREDQVAATRTRILQGVLDEMATGTSELSIPKLSKRTKVSVPTIYRYFPDRQSLLEGAIQFVDSQVPMPEYSLDPDKLHEFSYTFFRHRALINAKLGSLADSALLWEARKAVTVPRRRQYVEDVITRVLPKLRTTDPRFRMLSDIMVVLFSTNAANAFRQYVDNTADETAERINWIFDCLFADLGRPKK